MTNTEILINQYASTFNQKLHLNMQLSQNQYGAKFAWLYLDQWSKAKIDKAMKKPIVGVLVEYQNGQEAKPVPIDISTVNYKRFFDEANYPYTQFTADLLSAHKAILKSILDENKNKTLASLQITSAVASDSDTTSYTSRTISLFGSPKFANKYTEADREWIFDKIYKDSSDNLYMNISGKLFKLEVKPGTERELLGNSLSENANFWPAWFQENRPNLDRWNEIIDEELLAYDWTDSNNKSIEETLMDRGVPRIYLECLTIEVIERIEEYETNKGRKRAKYLEKVHVMLDTGSKNTAWTYPNQVKVFSKNLISSVDVSRVKKIPTFSNDPEEVAVKHLPKKTAVAHTSVPQLPKWWDKFLGGDRFTDPVMDKMKLAFFVNCTLDAKYRGRQTLVIGGEGLDGKGVLLEVLQNIIGNEYSVTCTPSDFKEEDRFGLAKIFNKKFVALTDCKSVSALMKLDKFKALTGSDMLSIDRKNLTSLNFNPRGLTVAIATNSSFYINGEFGRTRVMPIIMKKNFKSSEFLEKGEMVVNLLSEREEFLQWCADYVMFINDKCKGKLISGDRLMMVSDRDLKDYLKDLEDDEKDKSDLEFEYFKKMCLNQSLFGNTFCNWNNRTDEEEYESDLFKELYEEYVIGWSNFDPTQNPLKKSKDGKVYTSIASLVLWFNTMIEQQNPQCAKLKRKLSAMTSGQVKFTNSEKNSLTRGLIDWAKSRANTEVLERGWVDDKVIRKAIIFKDLNEVPSDSPLKQEVSLSQHTSSSGPVTPISISKVDEAMNGSSWTAPEHTAEEKASMDEFADLLVG